MEAAEKARVAERVKEWGEDGLQKRAQIVKEACRQNEVWGSGCGPTKQPFTYYSHVVYLFL